MEIFYEIQRETGSLARIWMRVIVEFIFGDTFYVKPIYGARFLDHVRSMDIGRTASCQSSCGNPVCHSKMLIILWVIGTSFEYGYKMG